MQTEIRKKKKLNRAFHRHPLEGKAKFTDKLEDKSKLVSASLFNICPKGMYLESNTSPDPESLIYIKIEDLFTYPPINMELFNDYLGKIRWSRRLNGNKTGYGLGIMILSNFCSICEEKIDYATIWNIDRYSFLCHKCHQNLMQLQDVKNKELVENFFDGNVF